MSLFSTPWDHNSAIYTGERINFGENFSREFFWTYSTVLLYFVLGNRFSVELRSLNLQFYRNLQFATFETECVSWIHVGWQDIVSRTSATSIDLRSVSYLEVNIRIGQTATVRSVTLSSRSMLPFLVVQWRAAGQIFEVEVECQSHRWKVAVICQVVFASLLLCPLSKRNLALQYLVSKCLFHYN